MIFAGRIERNLTVPAAAGEREAGFSILQELPLPGPGLPILTAGAAWPRGSPGPNILREIPQIFAWPVYSVFHAIRPMPTPIKTLCAGITAKTPAAVRSASPFGWSPQEDLNLCLPAENGISWARLDDGDVEH